MCGDGLTDLVRVRNGEVCYWPNLGYGRFGAKVTSTTRRASTTPDLYDPRRMRLADIDGSGPADLIYLGRDGARLYFNRSGNSLSERARLPPDRHRELAAVVDGRLARQRHRVPGLDRICRPMRRDAIGSRYLDIMGGKSRTC